MRALYLPLALGWLGILWVPAPCQAEQGPSDEGSTAEARAAQQLQAVRQRWIKLTEQVLRARAQHDILQVEQQLLANPQPIPPAGASAEAGWYTQRLQAPIREVLLTSQQARHQALVRLAQTVESDQQEALKVWHQAMEARLAFRDEVARAESKHGFVWGQADALPFFNGTTWAILSLGLGVLAGTIVLTEHLKRRSRRRQQRGQELVTAFLLVALSASPVLGAIEPAWMEKERERLVKECVELEITLSNLRSQNRIREHLISKARNQVLQGWSQALFLPEKLERDLLRGEEDTYAELHKILWQVRFTHELARSGQETLETLEKERAELARQIHSIRFQVLCYSGVRLLLLVLFLGGSLGLLYVNKRKQTKQQKITERSCPRCDKPEDQQSLQTGAATGLPEYFLCTWCGYECPREYLRLPRLSFPTVGVMGSGKTHWLTMAYHLIKNDKLPPGVAFHPALSEAAHNHFNGMEDSLLAGGITDATRNQHLPEPLTFRTLDADPWGRNPAMLNLFDFAGQVMYERINRDANRLRALEMDGFLLFLDPTQAGHGVGSDGVHRQNDALASFREEMRLVRQQVRGAPLAVDEKIDVPIAVCVSKFDLIIEAGYLGQQEMDLIRKMYRTRKRVTLEAMEERSELCGRVVRRIFHQWNITRTLEESFGKRYLFFPMTPKGVDPRTLGLPTTTAGNTRDGRIRFGVIEPILWLMHMQGYDCL